MDSPAAVKEVQAVVFSLRCRCCRAVDAPGIDIAAAWAADKAPAARFAAAVAAAKPGTAGKQMLLMSLLHDCW